MLEGVNCLLIDLANVSETVICFGFFVAVDGLALGGPFVVMSCYASMVNFMQFVEFGMIMKITKTAKIAHFMKFFIDLEVFIEYFL